MVLLTFLNNETDDGANKARAKTHQLWNTKANESRARATAQLRSIYRMNMVILDYINAEDPIEDLALRV